MPDSLVSSALIDILNTSSSISVILTRDSDHLTTYTPRTLRFWCVALISAATCASTLPRSLPQPDVFNIPPKPAPCSRRPTRFAKSHTICSSSSTSRASSRRELRSPPRVCYRLRAIPVLVRCVPRATFIAFTYDSHRTLRLPKVTKRAGSHFTRVAKHQPPRSFYTITHPLHDDPALPRFSSLLVANVEVAHLILYPSIQLLSQKRNLAEALGKGRSGLG